MKNIRQQKKDDVTDPILKKKEKNMMRNKKIILLAWLPFCSAVWSKLNNVINYCSPSAGIIMWNPSSFLQNLEDWQINQLKIHAISAAKFLKLFKLVNTSN